MTLTPGRGGRSSPPDDEVAILRRPARRTEETKARHPDSGRRFHIPDKASNVHEFSVSSQAQHKQAAAVSCC